MLLIDWIIVAAFILFLTGMAWYCRRYVRGVSDFLVAGRGVGKYLGMTAADASSTGLISIIAMMQAAYVAGLSFFWFKLQYLALGFFIATTGWITYRMRETCVLTLNELLERRYSRRLRIFCGMLCFLGGILNMGIYPLVEARFFIYFLSLPEYINIGGLTIGMMPLLSGFLVLIALFFCFIGGQISIIVTDFIQGCLILVLFIVLGIVAYRVVQWDQVERCIASLPDPDTKVNPFKARDFGLAYMGIRAFQQFYLRGTSAAGVGRTQSAKSAEEARLMILISKIKFGMRVSLYFIPVAALAFMTLPEFAEKARAMTESLNIIENKQVRSELVVPLFLRQILPVGVMGMLTASFLSLSISTYNTYFLSWGGTLIQDVVNPIRNKPLDSKRHLYVLRWGVIVVALVVWFLAQIYKPTDYIYMFFAITGAIYMSGAGIVVIGALYWRRATTQAAWAAMITGALLAFSGILVRQLWPAFPLNGIEISFFTWLVCIFVFVVVSFLSPKPDFDLDQLLKRKT